MHIDTAFDLYEKVNIDGNEDITATITGIMVSVDHNYISYEVVWFHNGDLKNTWITQPRLTPARV